MQLKTLGNSGLKVSVVGLGCNNFGMKCDQNATNAIVHSAIEQGITLFDTADAYGGKGGSEVMLGRALGPRRKDIVLATKFGLPMGEGDYMKGGSRRYIVQAVEASLRRLGTDYIDLYQLHYPDPDTPIEETLAALDDLVTSGKVRYIGSSNFLGWQLVEAWYKARDNNDTAFISAQNHYNLLDRSIENDIIPAAQKYGASILPYYPLARGLLTGKYKRGEATPGGARLTIFPHLAAKVLTDENFSKVDRLTAFANSRGHSILDLAIGWLVAQPHVGSVIAGASSPDQIRMNVAAGQWGLSPEELLEVHKMTHVPVGLP
ncbi:MAG: aldo/keto reductase [Rhizobiales bacterium]|nr:aldo/keto reductase [Hyphomicrobiales bacterium]